MTEPTNGYRDLKVWQRGFKLTLRVYECTADFPIAERYGLTSQMRRCASSIPANIAEGSGRDSGRDFSRFLSIALGSLKELETFLLLSRELGFIEAKIAEELLSAADELGRMIRGLQKSVRSRQQP
jgi:four helix bundle protein